MSDLKHAYPFDPTYGYTLEQLLAILPPEEPADHAEFWQNTYAETLSTPLELEQSVIDSAQSGFAARLIRFTGFGGVRLGAWLIVPADGKIDRYVVTGHGYYNRPFEDLSYRPGVANLFFGCRGLGISRTPTISDQTMFHVLHGIESKETYVHRGCVADTWSAGSAMLSLFPEAAGRMEYAGGSFGGGIGAMAMAWDDRFAFADIRIPSFGHHPLRLQSPCAGAGEAVRRKLQRSPELYERTLRYFDAAVHARRIAMPTAFACATFDPAVPPPGQFAVHNAARCRKVLTVWRTGHHDWSGTPASVSEADAAASNLRAATMMPAGDGLV